MGEQVYAFVRQNQEVNPKKKIIKTPFGIELVNTVVVNLGIHQDKTYPVELIVDAKIADKEIILGMTALKTLGYRITVAGKETRERPAARRAAITKRGIKGKLRSSNQDYDSHREDDRISFLDEEEARRIREWEY